MRAHTFTGARSGTDARLGQITERRGEREKGRELWVTDLAKVAYGAQANHTGQIQFNNSPPSIGNKTQEERDRRGEGKKGARGRRESLHFTEKAFVSSQHFTEMRKTMRNRGFRVSFSPEITDERWRKAEK